MSAVMIPSTGLRQMTEDDLDEVFDIERAAYEFPWTYGIFRDCLRVGYHCLVYEMDEQVVAYAVMSIGAGEAHILTLVVREDCRHCGLGKLIMNYLMQSCKRRHVDTMLLEVRPTNTIAVQLYRNLGFNEVGLRPNYYPDKRGREDAIIMALNLDHVASLHSI